MPQVDKGAEYVTQSLPPAVSAEERETTRKRHYVMRHDTWTAEDGSRYTMPVCQYCLEDWPCPVIRTLDALEAVERREDALVNVANAAQAFQINVVHQFSDSAHEAFGDLIADRMDYYHALVTALLDWAAHDARKEPRP